VLHRRSHQRCLTGEKWFARVESDVFRLSGMEDNFMDLIMTWYEHGRSEKILAHWLCPLFKGIPPTFSAILFIGCR
jgi:hypothetical protein